MNIFLILLILFILLIIYYLNNLLNKKKLNIKINIVKPKRLKKLEKKIILEPVDIEYYERLKKAKERLKEDRKRNYRMNKETINNEIAELPNETHLENIELRLIDNLNNLENLGNDNQNVHDTTVQDTIKKKYSELKKNILNNKNYNISDILSYAKNINKLKNKEEEEKLSLILEAIFNRNASIINLENAKEVDILMLMWDKIELREQIINELFDCYEPVFKHIVCPTGVVTRLINADIVINPESSPRTIEVLRTEMLNIAANTRKKLEEDINYKKLNEEDQNNKLKEEIKDILNKTYVNIISEDIIQRELDNWLDYI